MTFKEACEFFYSSGGVGKNVEDLMATEPSESNLQEAVTHAIVFKRQPKELAEEARDAIIDHWKNSFPKEVNYGR